MPPKCTIKRNKNEYKENFDLLKSSLIDILCQTSNFQFKCEFLGKLKLYQLVNKDDLNENQVDLIKTSIDCRMNDLINNEAQSVKVEDDVEYSCLENELTTQSQNNDSDDLLEAECMDFKNECSNRLIEQKEEEVLRTQKTNTTDEFDLLAGVKVELCFGLNENDLDF